MDEHHRHCENLLLNVLRFHGFREKTVALRIIQRWANVLCTARIFIAPKQTKKNSRETARRYNVEAKYRQQQGHCSQSEECKECEVRCRFQAGSVNKTFKGIIFLLK